MICQSQLRTVLYRSEGFSAGMYTYEVFTKITKLKRKHNALHYTAKYMKTEKITQESKYKLKMVLSSSEIFRIQICTSQQQSTDFYFTSNPQKAKTVLLFNCIVVLTRKVSRKAEQNFKQKAG
jgi:hypothetical protein